MRISVNSKKIIYYALWFTVFCSLFVYYYVAHPLILADTDDWYNASHWRRPLPIPGSYNSIKVFPETFFPLCSMIAVNILFPLIKDYIMSLALIYAFIYATALTVYTWLVKQLLKELGDVPEWIAYTISVIFLLMHFLLYKNDWYSNTHILWAKNVTCYFHYSVPVLLNACLVLYFITKENVRNESVSIAILKEDGYLKGGLILLLIYLAIFSNMFSNIVLASFSGIHGLFSASKMAKKEKSICEWFSEVWIHILIVLMWLLTVVLQATDLRSAQVKEQGANPGIITAAKYYFQGYGAINKMAVLFLTIVFIFFLLRLFFKIKQRTLSKEDKRLLFVISESLTSWAITSIYLVLLSGASDVGYIREIYILLGFFFYFLLTFAIMIEWVIKRDSNTNGVSEMSGVGLVLPLLLFIICCQTMNYCKSYRDNNAEMLSAEEEKRIANDILTQFVVADENGLNEMGLHVVVHKGVDNNWPYPSYSGQVISDTLFRHGIISQPIEVLTVFDEEKNNELSIYDF